MASYINNWTGLVACQAPLHLQLQCPAIKWSPAISSAILVMFIEEMVAVRSQQGHTARLEESGEQEAYRRWQQYNQETLLL